MNFQDILHLAALIIHDYRHVTGIIIMIVSPINEILRNLNINNSLIVVSSMNSLLVVVTLSFTHLRHSL